jgi:hypothetical protein
MGRYSQSKLLTHMFLWKIVDYVSADDVVVNLVDPGMTKGTDLGRNVPLVFKPIGKVFQAIAARSVDFGASTYVDAVAVKGKESHGCFMLNYEARP